ncbi:MAG: ceramide glucosyltransferase [Pseudolabrys sp.]
MNHLILLAGIVGAVATLAHFISIAAVIGRFRASPMVEAEPASVPVSILRPVCGLENYIEETLRSSFLLDHPDYEVIFCAADADDPVLPLVRALMAEYPHVESKLLIGNSTVSRNPKLNNLVKGWHAARHPWVMMIDSNVAMPKDHVRRMLAAWRKDTGLVCSPPVGSEPADAGAELECGFLNTYQARWQLLADGIGFGFAQGKSMLWRRDILDNAGGIEALANEIAEDAAATKIVRARGLRVRLVRAPFVQPLGARALADVWRRQVRWARLRRETFRLYFVPELLVGAVPPLAAAALVAGSMGFPIAPVLIALATTWYGAEAALASAAGWQLSWRSVPLWMLRDALLPLLWCAAWAGNDFEWRGNAMSVAVDVFGQQELTAEP